MVKSEEIDLKEDEKWGEESSKNIIETK